MSDSYYISSHSGSEIDETIALIKDKGLNNVTGIVSRKSDGTFEGKNLNIPTKISDLINDEKFLTEDSQLMWYATCDTAKNEGAKVATTITNDFILKPGAHISINFSQINTVAGETLTLNIDNTGAYRIVPAFNYQWGATQPTTFCFTGTYYYLITSPVATVDYWGRVRIVSSSIYQNFTAGYALAPIALNNYAQYQISGASVWNSTTTYNKGDRARYNWYIFECVANTTVYNAESKNYPGNSADWKQLAPILELIDEKANQTDIPKNVSDLNNDSGFTNNVGTITGITMNGVSKGTNGVVDLGNVLTDLIAGTGLSLSSTTLNHSNSITAQTTQAIYPIKIDAQGHISGYGSAITPLTAKSTLDATKLSGTIPANCYTNTTYTSQSASSGGTTISLVTTGEKYTWNNKVSSTSSTITLSASNWNDNTMTITYSGITTDCDVFISAYPDFMNKLAFDNANILCNAQATNKLTFICENTPENDIQVNIGIYKKG